jgi:hypothetical protein
MSGMQTPHMGWQSSRPREIQEDSEGLFYSPLVDNPSDMVHPMMDISDFATDNGPFQLEEGQTTECIDDCRYGSATTDQYLVNSTTTNDGFSIPVSSSVGFAIS